MFWDSVVTTTKWVFLSVLFIAAIPVITYAAVWLVIGGPLTKLGGLGFLVLGFGMWTFGLWMALGRPPHWFEPGRNTDFDPRR